jgi:hypothetical protein
VQQEESQNEELLGLLRETLTLVKDVHSASAAGGPFDPESSGRSGDPGRTR